MPLARAAQDAQKTHHADRDKDTVVDEQPGLLRKADLRLWFCKSSLTCQGQQDVGHDTSAQAGEDDDPKGDVGEIIGALGVEAGAGIFVGELEESACSPAGAREAKVCKGKE